MAPLEARYTASNAGGSSAPATTTISVTAPSTAGISVVGSRDSMSSTATSSLILTSPTGASAGDLLLAAFTINNKPM